MASEPTITVQPDGRTIAAAPGSSLLDACRTAGIELEGHCGGYGACGGCHVLVEDGMDHLSPPDDEEEDGLDMVQFLTPESRLACRAMVRGDVVIRRP